MRALRQTVERVAVTDFTILIEGGIGPQPHSALALWVSNSGQHEAGEVARAEGAVQDLSETIHELTL
jgi:hypothetical protein